MNAYIGFFSFLNNFKFFEFQLKITYVIIRIIHILKTKCLRKYYFLL